MNKSVDGFLVRQFVVVKVLWMSEMSWIFRFWVNWWLCCECSGWGCSGLKILDEAFLGENLTVLAEMILSEMFTGVSLQGETVSGGDHLEWDHCGSIGVESSCLGRAGSRPEGSWWDISGWACSWLDVFVRWEFCGWILRFWRAYFWCAGGKHIII